MSVIVLPNAGHPNNGEDLDADVVRQQIAALTGYLQSLDLSNAQAGSILEAAFPTALNPRQLLADTTQNFVKSGLNPTGWTGLVVTFPSGVVYINGFRVVVAGGGFTVAINQDTYFDVDVNGVIWPTGQSNNAASPSLAANRIRLLIAVSNGSAIVQLNAGGLYQPGTTTAISLPIISSAPLTICDSLGNLIKPNSPNPRLLGRRGPLAGGAAGSTSFGGICPLPIIVPPNATLKATGFMNFGNFNTSQNAVSLCSVVEDAAITRALGKGWMNGATAQSNSTQPTAIDIFTPTPGLHTYTLSSSFVGGYQMSSYDSATIFIELLS